VKVQMGIIHNGGLDEEVQNLGHFHLSYCATFTYATT